MTVEKWIDEHYEIVKYHPIRIIFADTNKGAGAHWIVFKDCTIKKIKVTSVCIFLYV